MPILQSSLDTRSEAYQQNRAQMLALVEGFRALEASVRAHGEAQRSKFEQRGQLTPREARRDERQQMRIERTEARMRARHGGHLTWRERARLRHREDRASRHIYRTKHNHRHW